MAFRVHADFPGGNIAVDAVEGTTLRLRPDLRDTVTPWFYWYFAVTGAEGRRLRFVFDPQNIGVHGPAVSLDRGATWRWLGAGAVEAGAFSYSFPPGAGEVRFSVGMPYLRADWDRFAAGLRAGPAEVREGTLAQTPRGRDVPYLFFGNADAPLCAVLTARHHACEMMASRVLEGVIDGILAPGEAGEWLRQNVQFLVVPFMDADGVEQGDQGKNRAPHDHNRDYLGEPLHPEVRALKERLPKWLGGRPFVALDFHDPALSGPVHESIFFVEPENRVHAARLDSLCDAFRQASRSGPIAVELPARLAFGRGFNTAPSPATCSAWMGAQPGCLFAASLEVAYANASGSEVNAASALKLGRDFAHALRSWLGALSAGISL